MTTDYSIIVNGKTTYTTRDNFEKAMAVRHGIHETLKALGCEWTYEVAEYDTAVHHKDYIYTTK